jgi:hypothetical protein
MAKQFVIGNLQLKRPIVPLVVELNIVGVDKGELLIYRISSVANSTTWPQTDMY